MGFSNPRETGRPIKIKDDGLVITNNVGSIDFTDSGVSGSASGDAVTEVIPGSSGLASESPAEAVDDSNKVFTFVHQPKFITRNGVIQEAGGVNYTLSGSGPYVATFNLAPVTDPLEIIKNWY